MDIETAVAELRKARADHPHSGMEYVSAIGMIRAFAEGYPPARTVDERMADIRVVLDALERVTTEILGERS